MVFRRPTIWSSVALAIAFTIGAPLNVAAQPPPPGPPPYTAAPDAKDPKSVLFEVYELEDISTQIRH